MVECSRHPSGEVDMTTMLQRQAYQETLGALRSLQTYLPLTDPAQLGLSAREVSEYSIGRALRAMLRNEDLKTSAPREFEAHQEIEKRTEVKARKYHIYVPHDVLTRQADPRLLGAQQRDISVAASGGGYLVETHNAPPNSFLGALRATSITEALGVQTLDNLVGNVMFPRVTTAPSTSWLASETAQATESQPIIVQVPATRKTASGYIELSRQFMLQSGPVFDDFVLPELGAAVAAAVDAAVINGSAGGGQPQGIIGTSGVGTQSGTSLAWTGIVDMQYTALIANAVRTPRRLGFAGAPGVFQVLAKREKIAGGGVPIWDGDAIGGRLAIASTSVPSGDLVFGDWSSVIVASWGGMQIGADPFTKFQTGIVGASVLWPCDVVVLYPASFVVASSIT
jgi:HK97 family phage major capsid protein